jgi:glycosyltransferase involved in cell wall biosynthesis
VGYNDSRDKVPAEAVAVDLRTASKPQAWAKMLAAALKEERRFQPDAVLGNSIEVAALRAPVACIVHDLNFGSASRGWGSAAREAFYRFRSRKLPVLITVSEATKKRLESRGIRGRRTEVIHNGVDTALFCPAPGAAPAEEPLVFAYPSRILPGKGQHLALDALARLGPVYKPRAKLVIVGAVADPIFRDQLLIQAYGQPVEVVCDVPDIVPYYQQADVVLFPSVMEEGFGYTAIEAMSCGKPVIWFDQPGVREATGGIGLAVTSGDVDGLRNAMRILMDDPEQRSALGEAGRAYIEEHYGWEKVWSRYESVLGSI